MKKNKKKGKVEEEKVSELRTDDSLTNPFHLCVWLVVLLRFTFPQKGRVQSGSDYFSSSFSMKLYNVHCR